MQIYVAHWIAGQQRAMATHAFGTAGRSLYRNIDAASFLPSQQVSALITRFAHSL